MFANSEIVFYIFYIDNLFDSDIIEREQLVDKVTDLFFSLRLLEFQQKEMKKHEKQCVYFRNFRK